MGREVLQEGLASGPIQPGLSVVSGVSAALAQPDVAAPSASGADLMITLAQLLGRSAARTLFGAGPHEPPAAVDTASVLCTAILALLLVLFVLRTM